VRGERIRLSLFRAIGAPALALLLIALHAAPLLAAASPVSGCCKDGHACCRRAHNSRGPRMVAGTPCGETCMLGGWSTPVTIATTPPVSAIVGLTVVESPTFTTLRTPADREREFTLYQRPPPPLA